VKPERIGRRNRRLEVLTRTEVDTELGEQEVSWSVFATVWASVSPLRGQQVMEAGAVEARMSHRILIRYLVGLTPKHRLRLGSRLFEIHSASDMFDGHRYHDIMAEELVGVGA